METACLIFLFLCLCQIGILAWHWCRKKKSVKFKINTMDLILVVIGVAILLFVCKMIQLFETYMMVPDTLITCFFALCGGECGIMGMIKTNKDRHQDRKWQQEDRQQERENKNCFDDFNEGGI